MQDAPLIVLKELAGNPPTSLNALQETFAPYAEIMTTFWMSVWIVTCFVLAGVLIRAYREHKK